jgi:hypothetical protein
MAEKKKKKPVKSPSKKSDSNDGIQPENEKLTCEPIILSDETPLKPEPEPKSPLPTPTPNPPQQIFEEPTIPKQQPQLRPEKDRIPTPLNQEIAKQVNQIQPKEKFEEQIV